MTDDTHFLPSARLDRSEVDAQCKAVLQHGVLLKLLNTTSEPLAILNPQRQIVFCNEACWRAVGLSRQEDALGLRPGELLRCINAPRRPAGCGTTEKCSSCGLAQALVRGQEGHPASGQCLIECGDESMAITSEFRVQVTPLPELGPGWECYALSDISHETRRRALERTFFHDIMNRAFAMEGVSDALANESMAPGEREEFTTMLGLAVRGLVEEIKSQRVLLAAETRDLAVTMVALDALEILRNAVQTCATFWLEEELKLVIELGSQPVKFESDPALLGRVLLNLLKNAIEASAPGHTVTAGCHRDGDEVLFSVHNEAFMDTTVAASVFHRSFSTKGHGRGLGTYSVRLLTENFLGGKVAFLTGPESGTTFQIRLPMDGRRR